MSNRTFMKAVRPIKNPVKISKADRSISSDNKMKSFISNIEEIEKRSNSLIHHKIKLNKFGQINQKLINYEILNNTKTVNSMGMTINGKKENNKTKTNQDSYFILNNLFDRNFHIFCVLDGHGMIW